MKLLDNKPLLLILFAAFLIRLIGVWYGLPSLYHSDEPVNVIQALSYGARGSLEPIYYGYPTLHSYLLFAVYGLYFVIGTLFGAFQTPVDFGMSYFLNPTGLFLAGRLLSVVLGVGTVWAIYNIGRRFFSERIALLSSLMLAFTASHSDLSHWVLLEATVVFMISLAILRTLIYYQTPTFKTNLIASLVAGLAISTKYNAGFIFVPLFLVAFLHHRKRWFDLGSNMAVSALGIILGFLIASPYWLLTPASFIDAFATQLTSVREGLAGHFTPIPYLWPLWEMIATEWTIGLLLVSGLFYAVMRHRPKEMILLACALPTLFYAATWNKAVHHYLLVVYPSLIILGALFLDDVLNKLRRRSVQLALLALVVVPPLLKIVYYDIRLTRKDSRSVAEHWIEANIPRESVIAYENYVYGPNLFDPARFIKNEKESAILPLEIRERLLQERLRRPSYKLVNFRKDFEPQLSQKELLTEYVADKPFMEKLLEFRLPALATLGNAGTEYVVISSDNYDRYFLDQRPPEDSPAWYPYLTSRIFYRNVMSSKALKLLQEFKSTRWSLGPTIKIYQFVKNPDQTIEGE